MNRLILIAMLAIALSACGRDEPQEPEADAPTAAGEETAVDEKDETATEASQTDAAALEVVEESAAEPEPEEQAILLAQAEPPQPPTDWKYREGRHFHRLVPTQPTVGGAEKIEVGYFFWYGCPHCFTMEATIEEWAANKPANSRFVRIPATWNNLLVLHAQLYYTEEVLVRNGVIKDGESFHDAVFEEYHRRGNRLTSEAAIQRVFERFDVSAEDFERTWGSFEVAQKLRVAQDLMRRYGIASVPTVVVNGKYRTDAHTAGGTSNLIELIDELIQRESLR